MHEISDSLEYYLWSIRLSFKLHCSFIVFANPKHKFVNQGWKDFQFKIFQNTSDDQKLACVLHGQHG